MGRTRSSAVVTTVLDAAAGLLANGGPAALTARAVAAEAGVSVQSLYNRFGSFEAMLDDLVNRGFRDLGRRLLDLEVAPLAAAGDPLAVLVETLDRYRAWSLDRPELHRFMFQADLSPRTRATAHRTLGIVVTAAANAAEAGLLRSEPAPLLANQLLAALHGSIELELAGWTTGAPPSRHGAPPSGHQAAVATMLRGLTPAADET